MACESSINPLKRLGIKQIAPIVPSKKDVEEKAENTTANCQSSGKQSRIELDVDLS